LFGVRLESLTYFPKKENTKSHTAMGGAMNTVLLIEDDDSNALVLQDMFAFDGIPATLVSVESGEEAILRAAEMQPALILMDLRLPGMDGLETTQLLKANPHTRDIPVWALTAYAMRGDEQRARVVGCSEYFAKPLHLKELSDRITALLTQHDAVISNA
jgi:two-component system, cell cycle response regulator DivK